MEVVHEVTAPDHQHALVAKRCKSAAELVVERRRLRLVGLLRREDAARVALEQTRGRHDDHEAAG